MKKLTRTQLNLAVRLWTLANISGIDEQSEIEEGNRVRRCARKRAIRLLEHLGTSPNELTTDEDCIQVALRLKP